MLRFIPLFFIIIALEVAPGAWDPLAPGMEIGTFGVKLSSPVRNSPLTVLRIDPKLWDLTVVGTSWTVGSTGRTARQWCESHKLKAAVNAGMFGTDYRTHVGYLGSKGHVNSSHVNQYQSVAAFHPRDGKDLPEFRVFDLDAPGVTMEAILDDFSSVIQNLRLIKRPGENRWSQQDKRWSEAALGEDNEGRVLFIFSKTPSTMHDFNQALLSLGIGIVAAQHLEGGPQAQLFIRVGDVEHELFGSYRTSFQKIDGSPVPWPVPNVLGVRPKVPLIDQ